MAYLIIAAGIFLIAVGVSYISESRKNNVFHH